MLFLEYTFKSYYFNYHFTISETWDSMYFTMRETQDPFLRVETLTLEGS